MKHTFIPSLLIGLVLLLPVGAYAQTDPGTANLTHQWTFDDGTANDAVTTNPVNGVLTGGATIVNKALKLSAAGQYLTFSGSTLALKGYTALSQEIWFKSVAGGNIGYTMLSYFGNTSGGLGYNYVSTSAARGDNVSRTAITNGTYSSEIGANGTEYDDGVLHQMVSIVRADSVILYIDGVQVSRTANTIALSTISSTLAYLGKGGYTSDPTWLGSISKFSIYNKSLSAGEVKFLYQKGAEQSPIISSSATTLSFDDLYKSETITVSGLNLANAITISAPAGITVSPTTLASDASSATVTVTYDGTSTVNGNVILTSGSAVLNIPVKSYTNSCFTKLYPSITNLVADPYLSSLSSFAGWGTRSINTDPAYVYCGATSGKVTGTNAGSLDVTLTGKLLANTIYRVKAKVYAIGGTFQIGMFGWSGTQSDFVKAISTTGSWQDVDFTVTTGATLGTTQGLFFNNYNKTGTTGYIDNWEMYAIPKVYTSLSSLNFITPGSKTVTVRGVNLSSDIAITATDGFTVSPATLAAGVNGSLLTVTFNSATSKSGYVYFTSGSVKDSLPVIGSVAPTLVTSVLKVSMDEISKTASFTVTGYNLTDGVTLSAPAGITLTPSSLPSTVSGTTVTVAYDGAANSSGDIVLTSGTASAKVAALASRNDECFTPLYPNAVNLIVDPTCNTYVTDGWGGRSINTDPAYVYCGARSGKVTDSGSLDRNLTGVMKPNTQYRVKAKVYKYSSRKGQNMGNVTYTLDIDSAAVPEAYNLIKIAMDSACMYFSKYTPIVYNVHAYYNAGIPTAQASYLGSIGFGANTRYMWVGTAMHEMCHFFGSGTTNEWEALMVNGVWTGPVTTALIKSINGGLIYGDTQHFWPFGINQKEEVTNLGSIAVQEVALANTARIAKAMLVDDAGLPTFNAPVGVGVYGYDAAQGDIYHAVTTPNLWQDVDFTFTTGATLKATQGVFFNNGTGYIDNWEMYDLSTVSAVNEVKQFSQRIYAIGNNIVSEFELSDASDVEVSVYDMQGRLLSQNKFAGVAGYNKQIIDASLPKGVYLVKISSDEFSVSKKVIR